MTLLRRIRWPWVVDWLALPVLAWMGVAILWMFVWYCAGCVSAKYESGTETRTLPDGTIVVNRYRRGSYSDTREAGAMGKELFGDIDWQQILSNPLVLSATGGVTGLTGILGVLIHSRGKSKGRAEIRNASNPTPKSHSPTVAGA